MKRGGPAPPWHQFRVFKHPPDHAHLDAPYCLAAAAHWLHRLDDHVPSIRNMLKTMLAVLPPKLPRDGPREKHLRQAADSYGLAIFRAGYRGWNDLVDPTAPVTSIMIASVQGLSVPKLLQPPDGYRLVLLLGVPDKQGRFLIADPHPHTTAKYRVPVDDFESAWEATATETTNPKALVVWKP